MLADNYTRQKNLPKNKEEALNLLSTLSQIATEASSDLEDNIIYAYDNLDATYQEIGDAIGLTRQGAKYKYLQSKVRGGEK